MKNDDKILRDAIQKAVPEPQVNPWLTKRVVNSLQRRRQGASFIEMAAYGLSACVLVGVAVSLIGSASLSLSAITVWGATVATMIAVVAGFITDRAAVDTAPETKDSDEGVAGI